MFNKTLLIIALTFISFGLSAQFPMGGFGKKKDVIKGFIAGQLIDTVSNEPVPYATIVLKKKGEDKEINGVLSEDDGKFRLSEIPADEYDMYISFLGYNEKVIQVETTPAKPDLTVDDIYLTPANYMLDQVEITDQRALTEVKVDKLVFNAEQDASISGGDATEVLRKVPLLSVDFDGNVSLRGSQNLRILINGKPSGMFSSNVADALKMIPADEIKQVEVITTPSAKYDAEGSGGIINIITKKKTADGYSGSVSASVGNRQNNGTGNFNFAKGRFGTNASGSVFYSNPVLALSEFNRVDTIGTQIRSLTQNGETRNSRLGFRGTAGAFYDFNAYNSLNTSFSARGFSFNSDGSIDGLLTGPFGYGFTREQEGINGRSGYDWSTDYKRTYEEKDREFTLAFQLSGDQSNADNAILQTFSNSIPTRDELIFNDGDNLESTFQADYVHPLPNSMKLEVGAKAVLRDIDSDYKYSVLQNGTYVVDQVRSNVFNYNQDVGAGYVSMNFLVAKKFSVVAGVRYEYTFISGSFDDGETIESNSYQNILPNLIISRSLKNFQTIKLSYNQRIQRPSLNFINPFRNSVDSLNIQVGNPQLTPEIVHQVDFSYNTFIKGFGIFSSLYYRHTEDIIQQLLRVNDNGVGFNTFENVGINDAIGLNLFTTKNVNAFTIRGGFNINTFNYSSSLEQVAVTNPMGFEYNVNFGGTINLPKDWKADFFGFLRSPRFTIQGRQPNFSIYGVGVKKEFPKIKASLGIRIIEPFNDYKYFNSAQSGDGFSLESSFGIPFRSFGVSFDYRFGNLKFKERKTAIDNNDLLQGGNGQQQGAGGNGGGN
ncbi:TonB-dependent receptor domain-containing protein [Portibacter marinus]|uniref:TonB-dependent receptor domain-containing protein n=1 Tax=Portibacter marinus TaxID=2898660 RepID=UPI001F374933|nr:TonB-dependent receptor [Portibacter marinus]